jgi:hypothetical protein
MDLLSLSTDGLKNLQSKLSAPIKANALASFMKEIEETGDANIISHMMSTLESESTLFLRSSESSHEPPEFFRRSLCRVLRISPFKEDSAENIPCLCGKSTLDNYGDHQYNCKASKASKISTHNAINRIITQAIKTSGTAVCSEPRNVIFNEKTGANRIPDGTILGDLGDPRYPPGTYWDTMITTTHPKDLSIKQALTPHDRCLYGCKFKHRQYTNVTNSHLMVPFIIDSAGHIARSSMFFLEAIFRKISLQSQIPFSNIKQYWLKTISSILHQGITTDIIICEKSSKSHSLALQGLDSLAQNQFVDNILTHERESFSDSNPVFEASLRN